MIELYSKSDPLCQSKGRGALQDLTNSVGEMEERVGVARKENASKESAFLAMEAKVKSKNVQLDDMRVQLEEYSSKVPTVKFSIWRPLMRFRLLTCKSSLQAQSGIICALCQAL